MEKQLPKNWVETELGNVLCRITNGANLEQSDINTTNSYPISRIETIANETIDFNRVKYCLPSVEQIEKYLLTNGDILFSHINSDKHLGKTAIYLSSKPLIHGVNLLLLRSNSAIFNNRTLNYLIKYMRLTGSFMDIAQRAVNQSSINQKKLSNLIIPLPPLAEQERIADKLDALFGQLDSIQVATSRIPKLIANLRQQILTYAITGKLSGYKGNIHIFANHLQSIKYGTSKKSDYEIFDGVPVLRIPNIKEGKVDLSDLKHSLFDDKEYNQLKLSKGDILVIRSNGSISLVGQSAIVDTDCDGFCYAGYLIRLRFNNDIVPEFINYSFKSELVRNQIVDLAHSTSGVNNINAQQIQNLSFVYYEKPEQEEIVRRVQLLFEKLDTIESHYNTLKQKIDNLPQAILHKAFKGELVEQLPTDGNAADLLREIEQLKENLKKK